MSFIPPGACKLPEKLVQAVRKLLLLDGQRDQHNSFTNGWAVGGKAAPKFQPEHTTHLAPHRLLYPLSEFLDA